MITGCLQQKSGFYYAVLYLKVNGRRRCKWVPMRLPVEGTSARKAQKAFDEIRLQYEREEEERLEREAKAKELAENTHPDALLPFTEYMEKWLQSTRSSLATATYQSYSNMIKARIRPYFAPLGLQLREVTPQHIENFYQSILADDCTTNTVIHYHAIIRKALQTAVKKDVLLKNPADKVDRPKKNVFHGSFYSEEEMLTLFDAVSGDPLELCVKIAAYYGLRRSEVLGLRWSAIDMEHKTISISHKVIEAEVDEKKEREPLVLPEKADNMKRAYWYLVSVRGISPKIVSHFMNRKMIYQEKKYGNCVFVGYDAEGTARYCSMRAARDNSSFKMDATGSDKSYPFFHEGKTDLLIVTEAPIDLMSHASIAADFYGRDWMQDHRISTGCLWNGAIDRYLEGHPQIKRLVFAVDNDYLARDKNGQLRNWGQLTAAKWMKAYTEKGHACAVHAQWPWKYL